MIMIKMFPLRLGIFTVLLKFEQFLQEELQLLRLTIRSELNLLPDDPPGVRLESVKNKKITMIILITFVKQ